MHVIIPKLPKTRRGAVMTTPPLRQLSALRSSAPGAQHQALATCPREAGHRKQKESRRGKARDSMKSPPFPSPGPKARHSYYLDVFVLL